MSLQTVPEQERKVIVSDHLINDGNKDTIEDASDLKGHRKCKR